MAERRMISKTITNADNFTKMPSSAQALYFHLNEDADDDGFNDQISWAKSKAHASDDDLNLLIIRGYVIVFESGVIVIRHWRMHNYIRQDRYKPTVYYKERASLILTAGGVYEEKVLDIAPSALGIPMVDQRLTEDSIELDQSKDRGSIGKDRVNTTTTTISSLSGACVREEMAPPGLLDVHRYMKDELCLESAAIEAEKFVAWNALHNWDCLPNWQAAADLWCARIQEREVRA